MKRLVELLFILGSILFVTGYISSTDKKHLDTILSRFVPSVTVTATPRPTPSITPVPTVPVSPTPQVLGEEASENPGFLVTRVVDGDTILLENGLTLRYIGINTPETVDPRRGVQCYGREASDFNKSLVLGKRVTLEKDVSETDRFGRLLRYVYIGDLFINQHLVQEGYAESTAYPPDIKYQQVLDAAEQTARGQGIGLWGSCK